MGVDVREREDTKGSEWGGLLSPVKIAGDVFPPWPSFSRPLWRGRETFGGGEVGLER